MNRKLTGLVSALALSAVLAACGQPGGKSDMPPLPASATAPIQYVRDIHSFARRMSRERPCRSWSVPSTRSWVSR